MKREHKSVYKPGVLGIIPFLNGAIVIYVERILDASVDSVLR